MQTFDYIDEILTPPISLLKLAESWRQAFQRLGQKEEPDTYRAATKEAVTSGLNRFDVLP